MLGGLCALALLVSGCDATVVEKQPQQGEKWKADRIERFLKHLDDKPHLRDNNLRVPGPG